MKRTLLVVLLGCFGFVANFCVAQDAPPVLRIATAFPDGHRLTEIAKRFQSELAVRAPHIRTQLLTSVARETNINMAVRNCWRFSRDAELIINGPYPLAQDVPRFRFLATPYLIEDFNHLMRLWDGEIGKRFEADLREKGGVVPLAPIHRSTMHLTSNKSIQGPADIQGLRLNVFNATEWVDVWLALKSDLRLHNFTAIPPLLKSGELEAAEVTLGSVQPFKLHEVQKFLVLTAHMLTFDMPVVNDCYFRKDLTEADQAHVRGAMRVAAQWASENTRVSEEAAIAQLKQLGMEVVVPDKTALRKAAEPDLRKRFQQVWTVATFEEVGW